MDYQLFLRELPDLYENWATNDVHPKSPKFKSLLDRMKGMTTPNNMQLLNHAVACLEENEIYCEIGSFHGSTLIGALTNHPQVQAYAVDNFSEFDKTGENFATLQRNLASHNLQDQVLFHNQDFEAFFFDLKVAKPNFKIGVYLYDGAHDYRSQLLGLTFAVPFLADRALIIVDDSNWANVRQANFDFLAMYPQASLMLDIPTRRDQDSTFWNGLQIITWDVKQQHEYTWADFSRNFRHTPLIKAIYNLSWDFELGHKKKVIKELEIKALNLEKLALYKEAESIYKEILQWAVNDAKAWYNLARLYEQEEKYNLALQLLHKSLLIDSSQLEAQELLSYIEAKLRDKDSMLNPCYQGIRLPIDLATNKQFATEHHLPSNTESIATQKIDQVSSDANEVIAQLSKRVAELELQLNPDVDLSYFQ